MTDDQTNDPLLQALRQMPREVAPPASLEMSTIAALRQDGLLRAPSARWARWHWLAAAVAMLAVFLGGRATGRPATAPPTPTYALVLYGGSTGTDAAAHAVRAAEYGAWASTERAGVHVLGGEALGDGGVLVGGVEPNAPAPEGAQPVGFFLVLAPTREAAVRLARECPHLKYGGQVVVREVLPT